MSRICLTTILTAVALIATADRICAQWPARQTLMPKAINASFTAETTADIIAIKPNLPGTARIENICSTADQLPGILEIDVLLPPDLPDDLWLAAFVRDKDGTWFQSTPDSHPLTGGWQTMRFDFSENSTSVAAAGHGAVWNNYWARHMKEVGLQFFSSQPWPGTILLRQPRIVKTAAVSPKAQITSFRYLTRRPEAYKLMEIEFMIEGDVGNPFNTDDIKIDAIFTTPDGRVLSIPAFYYQQYQRKLADNGTEHTVPQGPGVWRVRITPFSAGLHTWRLEGQIRGNPLNTLNHSFSVAEGTPAGFVRVSKKNPLFLETADDKFFYGIGHNIRSPTDTRSAQRLHLELPPDRGTFAYDDYFEKMAANGENAVMIWMSNWWVSIEWNKQWTGFHGINDYHLGNAWRLDYLFEEAQRHGIYIYLNIDNHGKYSTHCDQEWSSSPFNRANGGPCHSPLEMFSRDDMFEVYRQRIRYITARWGAYSNLLGWNLISEIDLTGIQSRPDRNEPSLFNWVRRAAGLLHELDMHNHIVGVQWSSDWRMVYAPMAELKELDIIVGDSYKGDSYPMADLMIETAQNLSKLGKPYFTAEYGGNWSAAALSNLRADFHAGLWANAMTVNAMSPMLWWFDYIDRENLYHIFKPLADFTADWDPRTRRLQTIHSANLHNTNGENTPVRAVLLYMDDTDVNGWIYDTSAALKWPEDGNEPKHSMVALSLSGLTDGDYVIEFWDTGTGTVMSSFNGVIENGKTTLTIPDFTIDVAFKLRNLNLRNEQ